MDQSSPEVKITQTPTPEKQPPENTVEEIPTAAEETLSPDAKATVEQMQPESRHFFGKLFDRIKSSEIVQNITDRCRVWRDERLAQRVQGRLNQVIDQQQDEEQQAEQARQASEKVRSDLTRFEGAMSQMGKSVDEGTRTKVEAEKKQHDEVREEHQARAQELTGRIADVQADREAYLDRAKRARQRLDGRLESKMNVNSTAIERYSEQETRIDWQIKSKEAENKKLVQGEADLEMLLSGLDRSSPIRSDVQRQIQAVRKQIVALEEAHSRMVKFRDGLRSKISILEGKNQDLAQKRRKILLSTQPSAEQPEVPGPTEDELFSPEPEWNGGTLEGEGALSVGQSEGAPVVESPVEQPDDQERGTETPEQQIASAKNFEELYQIIKKLGEIQGVSEKYSAEELISTIDLLRADKGSPDNITRTYGLRNSVLRLLQLEWKKKRTEQPEKEKSEVGSIEIKPNTARRGEIIITAGDGKVRRLTHKYSDFGPCVVENNPDGSFTIKPLDQLTDADLKPFKIMSSQKLKLLGLGNEIVARMAKIAELEGSSLHEQLMVVHLLLGWNQMVGKKSGLQMALPSNIEDLTKSLENKALAHQYLLKSLADKLLRGKDKGNVQKLSQRVVAMVEKFWKTF